MRHPGGQQFYTLFFKFYTNNTYTTTTTNYQVNGTLYISTTIPYLLNAGTVNVTVENTSNGDLETVVLTGVSSRIGHLSWIITII